MNKTSSKIKVWDFPTRFFHWSLFMLLILLWLSAENAEMQWHQVFSYLLMVLLIFRLLWGFIGSETSKFKAFLVGPTKVIKYLKSTPKPVSLGHNPIGGYMVMALLAILSLQLATGLFATDEVFTEGPLYSVVDEDLALWLTWVHKVNFNLLLAFVSVHILAVLGYWLKGDNLIKPMLTGYKKNHGDRTQPLIEPKMKSGVLAAVVLMLVAVPVWLLLLKPVVDYF